MGDFLTGLEGRASKTRGEAPSRTAPRLLYTEKTFV
jgi:hypothetical protein